MGTKNVKAVFLAFVAGIILLVEKFSSVDQWILLQSLIGIFVDVPWLDLLFAPLIILASLGGLAVIAGGVLLAFDRRSTGKIMIELGTGMGILGILITVVLSLYQGVNPFTLPFFLVVLAIAISLLSRHSISKKK